MAKKDYGERFSNHYLSPKNAAKYLGVSTSTLRNWDREGKLKALRNPLNGYRNFAKKDLDELIAAMEASGPTGFYPKVSKAKFVSVSVSEREAPIPIASIPIASSGVKMKTPKAQTKKVSKKKVKLKE